MNWQRTNILGEESSEEEEEEEEPEEDEPMKKAGKHIIHIICCLEPKKVEPKLSKKDQKKKEMEELDALLGDIKGISVQFWIRRHDKTRGNQERRG